MPKKQILGDSMAITINFKWLLQIIAGTAIIVYAFWQLESRIQSLENQMILATQEIELYEQERKMAEEKHVKDLEAQMQQDREWFQKELGINFNPLSWGKRSNKK